MHTFSHYSDQEANPFDFTNVEITVDKEDPTLDEMLESFKCYLLGCGYCFDGEIQIINEDVNSYESVTLDLDVDTVSHLEKMADETGLTIDELCEAIVRHELDLRSPGGECCHN